MDLLDMIYQREENIENRILVGDCRKMLNKIPSKSVDTCITSPPYFNQRDYGSDRQIGNENTLQEYIANLTEVFRDVRRTLKDEGTLWLNLGDTYCNKQLLGVPWRVAFALQDDGWILRTDIVWEKTSCLPESVIDRPSRVHEYIFLFTKNKKYYYNKDAIMEPMKESSIQRLRNGISENIKYKDGAPGQGIQTLCNPRAQDKNRDIALYCNKKSVWRVAAKGSKEKHFAAFSPELIRPCVKATCPKEGIVLDPFFGSGTSGVVAIEEGCNYLGIEINPEFAKIAENRITRLDSQYAMCSI